MEIIQKSNSNRIFINVKKRVTSGNKVIFSPPLVITKAEVDVIYNALETAFVEMTVSIFSVILNVIQNLPVAKA